MCIRKYTHAHKSICIETCWFQNAVWAFAFQKGKAVLIAFWEHTGISKIILGEVKNGNQQIKHFAGDVLLDMKS